MRGSPALSFHLVILCATAIFAGSCGSPDKPSPATTTTTAATTTSTSTSTTTSTSSTTSTSTTSTSSTTSSIPSITPYYGTYNVTFTKVRDDGCSIVGAATGTLKLSGNPDGSGFRAEVSQPSNGLLRVYMGTIRVDGSFNGTGAGITPGAIGRTLDAQPAHEYEGTIVGQVIGNNVTATETLTITVGCTGRPIVVYNIAGSK